MAVEELPTAARSRSEPAVGSGPLWTECPTCAGTVRTDTTRCPHCGARTRLRWPTGPGTWETIAGGIVLIVVAAAVGRWLADRWRR